MAYTRTMGLDVGSVTVGIAVSDLLGITAQSLKTLRINEDAGNYGFDELLPIIQEQDVTTVVIGLPKNMDNSIGPRAEASLRYGELLQERAPELTIHYQDERLTTSQAERLLIEEFNASRQKRREVIDQMAAVLILQNYLDSQ